MTTLVVFLSVRDNCVRATEMQIVIYTLMLDGSIEEVDTVEGACLAGGVAYHTHDV